MKQYNLIADGRIRHYDYPISRDWLDIDCKAVGCKYNREEKCMVPSIAKIGENGQCTGFTPKPTPTKIDGD